MEKSKVKFSFIYISLSLNWHVDVVALFNPPLPHAPILPILDSPNPIHASAGSFFLILELFLHWAGEVLWPCMTHRLSSIPAIFFRLPVCILLFPSRGLLADDERLLGLPSLPNK